MQLRYDFRSRPANLTNKEVRKVAYLALSQYCKSACRNKTQLVVYAAEIGFGMWVSFRVICTLIEPNLPNQLFYVDIYITFPFISYSRKCQWANGIQSRWHEMDPMEPCSLTLAKWYLESPQDPWVNWILPCHYTLGVTGKYCCLNLSEIVEINFFEGWPKIYMFYKRGQIHLNTGCVFFRCSHWNSKKIGHF